MPAKPRLVVSRPLPAGVEDRLRVAFDTDLAATPRGADDLVLRAAAHRADGMLVCLSDPVPAGLIRRLPDSVRVIATYSVGFNHVDLDAARARGIAVTYTPEAVTEATADCALLLILAACRQAHAFQLQMWAGAWTGWSATGLLGSDPGGQSLGIVGMGRIGQAVARRARAFGMDIHYFARHRLDPALEDGAAYHSTLESLFRASRIVSLHTPSTPDTRGMINRDSLAWLPDGAVFVNTARGDQVVDDDLIAALQSGRLAAAGLDVFAGEPLFDRRYLDLPNAFLLPHIGTSTAETRDLMGRHLVEDLQAFFAGGTPRWRVA
jgi:glyoxylate reductase